MKLKKHKSLKAKIMLLLMVTTTIMLSTYALLALSDFKKDKIAYVFDSNLSHSRSLAISIHSDIEFVVDKIKFYLKKYNSVWC